MIGIADNKKRSLQDESEDLNGAAVAKRTALEATEVSHVRQDDMYYFKMLCPADSIGTLIGKAGAVISQLNELTGAKIKISQNNEFYPGTNERVICCHGTRDCLASAVAAIIARILEALEKKSNPHASSASENSHFDQHHQQSSSHSSSRDHEMHVLIPTTASGIVIGRGGVVIKQMSANTQCRLKLSDAPDMFDTRERIMYLRGDNVPIVIAGAHAVLAQMLSEPTVAVYVNTRTNYNAVPSRGGAGGAQYGVHDYAALMNPMFSAYPDPHLLQHQQKYQQMQQQQQMQHQQLHMSRGAMDYGLPHPQQHQQQLQQHHQQQQYQQHQAMSAYSTMYNMGAAGGGMLAASTAAMAGGPQALAPGSDMGGGGSGYGGSMPLTMTRDHGHYAQYARAGAVGPGGGGGVPHSLPSASAAHYDSSVLTPVHSYAEYGHAATGPRYEATAGGGGDFAAFIGQLPEGVSPPSITTEAGRVTLKMGLTEQMVGGVLGRGGSIIRDIISMSAASLRVSQKGEYLPGTTQRVITVSGAHEQVQNALGLLVSRLHQIASNPLPTGGRNN